MPSPVSFQCAYMIYNILYSVSATWSFRFSPSINLFILRCAKEGLSFLAVGNIVLQNILCMLPIHDWFFRSSRYSDFYTCWSVLMPWMYIDSLKTSFVQILVQFQACIGSPRSSFAMIMSSANRRWLSNLYLYLNMKPEYGFEILVMRCLQSL